MDNNAEYNRKKRRRAREWANDYKVTRGCAHCGENHVATLVFHHVDGSKKEGGVSRLVSTGLPAKVREEVLKCQVLCWNCHRKLHYYERLNKLR